ncbi:ribokinase [Anaerostipes sp.]|uniref:ribokinase n=1 Tax=Anaerostipes sp. TaxID=1872530 RepID=UPI0025BFAF92|nr:ribokinase [Anaerostipes sp.]MBS7008113.1 ribokinase [Anaerostipes sp.]
MKILNFGSLNIDYVYGVSHFVEKGETISSDTLQVFAGGKGLNQSIALSRAGADVYHAGVIGADGMFLGEILCEAGVDTRYLKISQETRTGNAVIQKDREGDNCIILYGGANQAVTKELADMVLENFEKGDWMVLQNEISEIPYLVEKAHEKGMQIVLNPSPMNEKIFDINLDYIDCFLLNEVEARALLQSDGDSQILLKQLKERFSHAEIVLTLGEKGSMYAGEQGIAEQSAYKVDTVDTTAAGDTFTGYYTASRLLGKTVEEALYMAARASAIAVSKMGAAPSIPERDQVLEFAADRSFQWM